MSTDIVPVIIIINISLLFFFYRKLSLNGEYRYSFAFLNTLYIFYAFIFFPFVTYFFNISNPFKSIDLVGNYYIQANFLITVYLLALNVGILISDYYYKDRSPILKSIFNFDFIKGKGILLYTFLVYSLLKIFIFIHLLNIYNPIEIIQNRALFDSYYIKYNLAYIIDPLNGICTFIFIILLFEYLSNKKYSLLCLVLSIHLYSSSLYGSRAQFILVFIFLFIVYYIIYKKIKITYILFLLFGSIVVFAFIGSLRTENDFILDINFLFKVLYYRSDYIPGLTKLIAYISNDEIGYYYGQSILDFIFSFLPRSIIEYKPHSIEVILTYILFGTKKWTLAFGGIGEMFYNFSYQGVFIWFIFVGFFIDRLNKLFINSINAKKYIISSFLLSTPFYLHGWNMGVNVSPTRKFIIIYSFILINFIMIKVFQSTLNTYNSKNIV